MLQDHIWNAHCSKSMFAIYALGSMCSSNNGSGTFDFKKIITFINGSGLYDIYGSGPFSSRPYGSVIYVEAKKMSKKLSKTL